MNRKQTAIIQIAASTIAALALIAILIAGLTGHFFGRGNITFFGIGGSHYYENAGRYSAGSGEIPADQVKDIDINWVDGAIDVTVYEGDTVQFTESSSVNLKKEEQLHYYNKNGRLMIQYQASAKSPISFFAVERSFDKDLEIRIPKELAAKLGILYIDTVSSQTNISDVNAESMEYDATSGDVTLTDCSAARLEFDCTSGSLIGSSLFISGKLTADTTSGDVRIEGRVENLEFESTSGSLEFDSDVCPKKISTDCTSGDITLTIPENDGFDCLWDTTSGDFTSDFEMSWKDEDGTYKGGGSLDYSFDSTSGNVHIKRK